ncbi:aconitase X catalytic domain-containing protein [Sulfobacillus thermosulfidooxidans]|uniref:aconitase X catalytic domain-containing protein n=1 Tax=Sulfobacillus thermosulfidooxidans TaxID=28034 RepID=UPI0006B578BC|nr:aconitase X catalytic domain-containing protein [Sulfobacillus thermosulfidooxidans]
MVLTEEEIAMLEGKYGEGTALAMRIQVGIGEAFDAQRLVPISRAHVALSNQEADLWFVEKLLHLGAACRVSPTVNPGFDLSYFSTVATVKSQDLEQMARTAQAYRDIGAILNYSCTPYLFDNIPRLHEIIAFSESSATPYVNAVYGARTNRESAQSALCAAITGRVPEYGLLLDEARYGTVLVQIEARLQSDFDYQLLGYAIPKKIHGEVPVFMGIPKDVTPESLMNLGAELNTAGAVPMYHILGVTPEAQSLEQATGYRKNLNTVVITNQDLERVHDQISKKPGPIEFVMLGCPHLTLRQIQNIAQLIHGHKLRTELWINTSAHTRLLAERLGIAQIIEDAGGHILQDSCVDQPIWAHLAGKIGATDSPKCAYYTARRSMDFVIRSIEECVAAAIKGEI